MTFQTILLRSLFNNVSGKRGPLHFWLCWVWKQYVGRSRIYGCRNQFPSTRIFHMLNSRGLYAVHRKKGFLNQRVCFLKRLHTYAQHDCRDMEFFFVADGNFFPKDSSTHSAHRTESAAVPYFLFLSQNMWLPSPGWRQSMGKSTACPSYQDKS